MSHSTVLIIGPDPEKQLEPFDENTQVEPYKRRETISNDNWPGSVVAKDAPEIDLLDLPAVAAWLNARWGEVEESERYHVDEEGLFTWSRYNPLSKWDWYALGGRWAGFFLLKEGVTGYEPPSVYVNQFSPELAAQEREHFAPVMDGRHTDAALKGDIDWEGMTAAALKKAGENWDRYQAELAKDEKRWAELPEEKRAEAEAAGRKPGAWLRYDFDVEDGDTRESYVARQGRPSTFAVLKDGEWYERGHMGWWGMVRDEKDSDEWQAQWAALVEALPDDTLLSVYDVHI